MAVAPSAPVLLFLLLALLVAADAAVAADDDDLDHEHYDEDDYDDDADYPVDLPPAVPDTTTITSVAPTEGGTSPIIATSENPTVIFQATTTEGNLTDEDEKALHSLVVDGSEKEEHEGSKRAGSTQAKGAATITRAMHNKPAKGIKDRGAHSRSNNKHGVDSDEATNTIWGYTPTTPIDHEDEDEDEEEQQAKKVLTPFELVTRRPIVPTQHLVREKEEKGRLPTDLQMRLRKLDFYFTQLAVMSEDCRRRLLCQLADQPNEFQPLSFILLEETSFRGDYGGVRASLMSSTNGARLLTYMEATASGQDRSRGCSGFAYRCPTKAHDMIDMEALGLWRDMLRWMSVQVVALRSTAAST
ncbi:Hypothetical predicted protein [Cloeon dipterum]|uniref:Uncharacterized protein n=3 Tax=Cloeon dipterum TaxID=197152 RepID=A0A8S1D2N5_9INSE|nr:Hypothetical predicted protein [Cloeon dipterum]